MEYRKMKNIEYKDNKLFIGDIEILFTEKIQQIRCDNDKIFILLDIPQKTEFIYDDYHNVYCYSMNGTKIWQIGIRPKGDKAVYTMINADDTYLFANDFLGRRYYIDKNTGNINKMEITK